MGFTSRYQNLNTAQKQAVDTIEGPLMVIAGPGTGKTELLSMRVARILQSTDTLAENILCLTFTDSGAHAIRERLIEIIGRDAYKVAIHTFHSFGADIMSQFGQYFYHGAHFRPSDELSSYELIRTIFDELEHSNPLASTMNGEYTYLPDTLTAISDLKKSGLTSDELLEVLDANDEVIELNEPLLSEVFANKISKSTTAQLEIVVKRINESQNKTTLRAITPLSRVLVDSLRTTVENAHEDNSTKPITAWKNKWLKKDEAGKYILKSRERQAKLRAVSYIYYQYLSRMQEAELYDFDDMILRVVHAMEVFPDLRYNLQERYQYIMVDEFQDTNMAQMRVLYNLTNNEAAQGQPNIMAVGDDDQAIYSFQGADVSNISHFMESFANVPLIPLTENYRSTPQILTSARSVVTASKDRLENRINELNKTLVPHLPDKKDSVSLYEHTTLNDERQWLTREIKQAIEKGTVPSSITVLARRHHELLELLPHFAENGIAVNYERRDNVLELDIIHSIELISQVVVALFNEQHIEANALLPRLLSHSAFQIQPVSLWKLSIAATQNKQSWMEVMESTPELQKISTWLLTLAYAVPHTPLERILDVVIGFNQSEDAEFISPIYNYYFGVDELKKDPDSYIICLEALRTIRSRLHEYQPSETPNLITFIEFIRLHRKRGSVISSVRAATKSDNTAVNLMTVHRAKGLEFDTVYIVGAVDSAWGERVRSRSKLISYPENLPLSPVGDTYDERLRLFYVAMTRARHQLTISYATRTETGKPLLRASFLNDNTWFAKKSPPFDSSDEQIESTERAWYAPIIRPITSDMHAVLSPMLDNYKLSSTHLSAFLDVTHGGPEQFLMNYLLRFPHSINPSAGYGVAVHAALQRAHAHLTATGSLRAEEDILHDFEKSLIEQQLTDDDFAYYLQKGSDTLRVFLEEKYHTFKREQKVEINFGYQSVYIGDAHLTGSVDLMDIQDNELCLTDYKTGRPARNWKGTSDYDKIRLHKYKQQLLFYDLLVRNSRDYHKYTITNRVLQFVEPTSSGAIVAIEADFSNEEREQFSRLIQAVWTCITTLTFPDISKFDQNYNGIVAFESYLLDEI